MVSLKEVKPIIDRLNIEQKMINNLISKLKANRKKPKAE